MCEYDAITVDTNIFEKENYNLENGILATFEQFATLEGIDFILSEIVYNEIICHMEKNTLSALSNYIKSLNNSYFYKLDDSVTLDKIKDIKAVNVQNVVKDRIDEYQRKTNFELIPIDGVDAKEVVKAYFEKKPPFSEKKKEEFPDAFALQSLENWAKRNEKKILVVSKDKDWQLFCEKSSYLDCYTDIISSLAELYKNKTVIKDILWNIIISKNSNITSKLYDKIVEESLNISFNVDIISSFDVEEEFFSYELESYELSKDKNSFHIINNNNNIYTLSIGIKLVFHIEGEYTFYWEDDEGHRGAITSDYLDEHNVSENSEILLEVKFDSAKPKNMEILSVKFNDTNFYEKFKLEPELDFEEDYY